MTGEFLNRPRRRATHLTFVEIDVAPFERDHLAAAQAGITAEQHDQLRLSIQRACRLDKPFVLLAN